MPVDADKTELSVIVPVWNEERENIRESHSRLKNTLAETALSYEIIFVDDGSGAETSEFLKSLVSGDKNTRLVRLEKNCGQTAAFLAGLRYAKGEIIVTTDIDMQYMPEDIPILLKEIDKGHDMASGWRRKREDPFLARKVPSYIINRFLSAKTGVCLHDWGCSFNAFRRGLAARLYDFGDAARFAKPLLAYLADSPVEAAVRHRPRKVGKSKYGLLRLCGMAFDILFNFTLKPEKTKRLFFSAKEVT